MPARKSLLPSSLSAQTWFQVSLRPRCPSYAMPRSRYHNTPVFRAESMAWQQGWRAKSGSRPIALPSTKRDRYHGNDITRYQKTINVKFTGNIGAMGRWLRGTHGDSQHHNHRRRCASDTLVSWSTVTLESRRPRLIGQAWSLRSK